MTNKTSKWFRVATEGATADGRIITGDHLKQCAANFDPQKYGARIWLEHLRGTVPGSPFDALGDVVALKTELVDGKTCLLAQINPLDKLIQLNADRQKIYTSIELDQKFADSGEAYLVGLAVTDSPASLGTEALQFTVKSKRPDDYTKHLFSAACDTVLSFEDAPAQSEAYGKFAQLIEGMIQRFTDKFAKPADAVQDEKSPNDQTLHQFKTDLTELLGSLKQGSKDFASTQTQELAKMADRLDALETKFATLDNTPSKPLQHHRHTGAGDVKTDC